MRVRAAAVAVWVLTAACGSRTPLIVGETPEVDASAPDASPPDASGMDAAIAADVLVPDCVSAAASFIYLVSDTSPIELYSVNPANGGFSDIGTLDCPTSDVPKAFSIAVDRKGNAFVLTTDFGSPAQGALWQVSTSTAHCEPVLDYARGQLGFSVFGMAFATNGNGPDETLYIEGASDLGSVAAFGKLDPSTWRVTYVGTNEPPISRGQLTGTGDGRLFELYYTGALMPDFLPFDQVDPTTGGVTMSGNGPTYFGTAFSVARSDGEAYAFLAQGGPGETDVFPIPDLPTTPFAVPSGITIAGAGVSTCAPP
jgi:hypothetical protein